MVELDVGILRCVFQTEPNHREDANLRLVVTGNDNLQMLKCVSCSATFLVKAGIAHMIEDNELDKDDRRVLQRLRRQYKHQHERI
jgi:hypothetical protein